MRCLAAVSSAVRHVLAGPPRSAECLGAGRGALYLKIIEPPGALAVLCHDAVRLPCGLLLPATSAELPLTSLVPPVSAPSAGFLVGDHAVRWTGPAGPVVVRAARQWAPARPARGEVNAAAFAAVRVRLGLDRSSCAERRQQADGCRITIAPAVANFHPWAAAGADQGIDARLLAVLAWAAGDDDAIIAEVTGLLGSGPGLTPAGDDVLAGFLVGAAAFGLDAAALRHAIAVRAPARTTTLSAALLWHAARGECIDELAALAAVLTDLPPGRSELRRSEPGSLALSRSALRGPEQADRAVSRLLGVGHSSGAAQAVGLVTAAECALRGQGLAA